MDNEIADLDARISRLIEAFAETRRANGELTDRVARLEADNRVLAEKLATAVARIEAVLEKLPVTEP
ncbi:hypothetical protein ACDA63_10320 [Uliginosibacterium sp. sgz301328]|uniref:hypothetical protein n=1 Tax=Uliginosibacterium sp. sgz301328 TaxID=3243764 RepID=UPI00359CDFDB